MSKLTSSQWRKLSLVPLAAFVLVYKLVPPDKNDPGTFWMLNIPLFMAAFYCLRRGMDVDRKPAKPSSQDADSINEVAF